MRTAGDARLERFGPPEGRAGKDPATGDDPTRGPIYRPRRDDRGQPPGEEARAATDAAKRVFSFRSRQSGQLPCCFFFYAEEAASREAATRNSATVFKRQRQHSLRSRVSVTGARPATVAERAAANRLGRWRCAPGPYRAPRTFTRTASRHHLGRLIGRDADGRPRKRQRACPSTRLPSPRKGGDAHVSSPTIRDARLRTFPGRWGTWLGPVASAPGSSPPAAAGCTGQVASWPSGRTVDAPSGTSPRSVQVPVLAARDGEEAFTRRSKR